MVVAGKPTADRAGTAMNRDQPHQTPEKIRVVGRRVQGGSQPGAKIGVRDGFGVRQHGRRVACVRRPGRRWRLRDRRCDRSGQGSGRILEHTPVQREDQPCDRRSGGRGSRPMERRCWFFTFPSLPAPRSRSILTVTSAGRSFGGARATNAVRSMRSNGFCVMHPRIDSTSSLSTASTPVNSSILRPCAGGLAHALGDLYETRRASFPPRRGDPSTK